MVEPNRFKDGGTVDYRIAASTIALSALRE